MNVLRMIVALVLMASAQSVLAAIPDPESIPGVLTKGNDSAITELAKSLGMTIPKEWVNGAKADKPCDGYDSVVVARVSLFGKTSHEVITAHAPSMCEMTYVVIMDRTPSKAWKVIDILRFREHDVSPEISFEKLVSPEHNTIVVKNNDIDSGTGIENIRMTIFSVEVSGARIIFDEPMRLNFAIPAMTAKQGNTDQTETDEYTFINDTNSDDKPTGTKYIRRAEHIRDHDVQITRWWNYSWDPVYSKMSAYQYWPSK